MAFTYGSEALNQLAQEVSREPADLSTKADVSALATTNAVVATKQTTGEPVKLDSQVITTDTTLDPDIAYWLIDATANAVTLTFPHVGTVEGRQFAVTCVNADHVPLLSVANPGDPDFDIFLLSGNPSTTVQMLSGQTMVFVARTIPSLAPHAIWVSQSIVNPLPAATAVMLDTTAGAIIRPLLSAVLSPGVLRAYKNTGTGAHSLTVNRAGADTIDGGTAGVVIADGKTAVFVRDEDTPTNWVLISLA